MKNLENKNGKKDNLVSTFKRQTKGIEYEKIKTWLRRGNFKRETKSIIMIEQNKAIRTNYIRVKFDNPRNNSLYSYYRPAVMEEKQ